MCTSALLYSTYCFEQRSDCLLTRDNHFASACGCTTDAHAFDHQLSLSMRNCFLINHPLCIAYMYACNVCLYVYLLWIWTCNVHVIYCTCMCDPVLFVLNAFTHIRLVLIQTCGIFNYNLMLVFSKLDYFKLSCYQHKYTHTYLMFALFITHKRSFLC